MVVVAALAGPGTAYAEGALADADAQKEATKCQTLVRE